MHTLGWTPHLVWIHSPIFSLVSVYLLFSSPCHSCTHAAAFALESKNIVWPLLCSVSSGRMLDTVILYPYFLLKSVSNQILLLIVDFYEEVDHYYRFKPDLHISLSGFIQELPI